MIQKYTPILLATCLFSAFQLGCASTPNTVDIPTPNSAIEDSPPPKARAPQFTWPVERGQISDVFGRQRGEKTHKGLDIAEVEGTPIYAASGGRVVYRGFEPGYGNYIELRHSDGWVTRYGHLKEYKVGWSQRVERGQLLGFMGQTGRASGPHLHFEVRHYDHPMNPEDYLPHPEDVALKPGFGSSVSTSHSLKPIQSFRTSSLSNPVFWLRTQPVNPVVK